jgi:hypothetical protein
MHSFPVRRLAIGCIAASSLAILPAVAGANTTGWFKLPAGDTFTLSNTYLWGCDPDAYAYKLGHQPRVTLGDNSASLCDQLFEPDVTVGPFPAARRFRLVLVDSATTPSDTFRSTNGNHTTITGTTDDWQIQIGGSDFGAAPPTVPHHDHNFSTTLTIGAPGS